jgi:hypothetical protein
MKLHNIYNWSADVWVRGFGIYGIKGVKLKSISKEIASWGFKFKETIVKVNNNVNYLMRSEYTIPLVRRANIVAYYCF